MKQRIFTHKINFGLNAILSSGCIVLFTLSFFFKFEVLTKCYSLWLSATAVVLSVMLLMLSYDLFLWYRHKSVPSTMQGTIKTMLIILLGNLLLLKTNLELWKIGITATIFITIGIVTLLLIYLFIQKNKHQD